MFGTLALFAALLFVASALFGLTRRPHASLPLAQLILALAASALGILHWRASGDTRWLVGGVLLLGAAVPSWASRGRRAVLIAAIVCGLLGTALYGAASASPKKPVTPAVR
ncbi:hypothetical protein SAMN06297144_0515 [Sphingomonas guangdongensis]|uniref:Uncharacterized protein n=1 Tax=Sphingomonas guangdongensis TaxID=1141890 RepID=A0A285QBP9_9SPHN|nr:hypothetical protein [Sphingomonas guangdongensis]SOB79375.1 hypothetical protein SAMN06297144_0515 [Sphingomonas guangdongensis]